MTPYEYELAVRVVIGLAGCALIAFALVADWRADLRRPDVYDVSNQADPGWPASKTNNATTPASTWTVTSAELRPESRVN